MGFLSSGLWWTLFAVTSISFLLYSLARRNWELQIRWLNFVGGWCAWISILLVILTFVFTGWKGGLAVIFGIILVAVVGILAIRLIYGGKANE